MNTTFKFNSRIAKRLTYLMAAVLMLLSVLPVFDTAKVGAAQFSVRSIKMSDSSPSGTSITSGVGSGTSVTYRVTFTPTNQAASMVIDFCSQDPIVNDTCTTPTGMSAATGVTNVSGTAGGTGWTPTFAAGQVKLADSGNSAQDIQAATTQVFDITGITNPSTVGTFFARMYSYTNTSWGTYAGASSVANPPGAGNFVDYGGIAMTTVQAITITARVQEQLTFCVTKADPATWTTTHDCSDTVVSTSGNLPAVTLGHGTPTAVLDSNTVDTGTIYSQLSTNATSGAVVKMRNSNLTCGGLSADAGTTCAIPAQGTASGTAKALPAGTAAFGLFVSDGALGSNGSTTVGIGSLTPTLAYNDQINETPPYFYGMDNTTANNNVTSTFGSTLASTSAPCYHIENTYVFAATSALTTPAGIYTANLSMIATGTF